MARCVTPAEAYRDIDWRVVILIACMLALGQAMMLVQGYRLNGKREYLDAGIPLMPAIIGDLTLSDPAVLHKDIPDLDSRVVAQQERTCHGHNRDRPKNRDKPPAAGRP